MKKIEEAYRRFFNYDNKVSSGAIWFRICAWIVLIFILGVLIGRLL